MPANFGFPSPMWSRGTYVDDTGSDFSFSSTTSSLKVFNDAQLDGDSLVFFEVKPDSNGVFGDGIVKEVFVFQENFDLLNNPVQEVSPSQGAAFATYFAPIDSAPNSPIRTAVALILDNESLPTKLRRTFLGDGDDFLELFDSLDNTILAGGGNDTIRVGDGKNIVFGQNGNDKIVGGNGQNFFFGNQGNDQLFGGTGKDWLDGGLGDDFLQGGFGDDTYIVDSYGDKIDDAPTTGVETVKASLNWTLQAGLDHLFLMGNALTGQGNYLDNFIRGNNLNNTIEGADGNDVLFGDEIQSLPQNPFFTELDFRPYTETVQGDQKLFNAVNFFGEQYFTTGGKDTLKGGNGDDKLYGWGGDDELFGEAGNDWLFGGFGNDKLFGGDGDDRLDGNQGADRLEGQGGNDTYVIDDLNDLIVEAPQTGIETIESSITYDLNFYSMAVGSPIQAASGLDNLTLLGETNINGLGNYLANVIKGNRGNNILNGGAGDDTLIIQVDDPGLFGTDTVGDDTLIGGAGADKFRFNSISNSFGSNTVLGKPTIQDFTPGEDTIEISSSAFSNPTVNQFSLNGSDLLFGSQAIATIQSSSVLSTDIIRQGIRFI